MPKLKPFFTPQPAQQDEIDLAVEGIRHELENGENGDHTFYVLGDRMIYGVKDGLGEVQIYLGKIEAATEDSSDTEEFEDLLLEGPVPLPGRGKAN